MNFIPLNFALMANPVNWLVVALMLAIGGFGMSLIVHGFDIEKTVGDFSGASK